MKTVRDVINRLIEISNVAESDGDFSMAMDLRKCANALPNAQLGLMQAPLPVPEPEPEPVVYGPPTLVEFVRELINTSLMRDGMPMVERITYTFTEMTPDRGHEVVLQLDYGFELGRATVTYTAVKWTGRDGRTGTEKNPRLPFMDQKWVAIELILRSWLEDEPIPQGNSTIRPDEGAFDGLG